MPNQMQGILKPPALFQIKTNSKSHLNFLSSSEIFGSASNLSDEFARVSTDQFSLFQIETKNGQNKLNSRSHFGQKSENPYFDILFKTPNFNISNNIRHNLKLMFLARIMLA
jgi:hypothetical protein